MAPVSHFITANTNTPEKDLEDEKARLARMLLDSLPIELRLELIRDLSSTVEAPRPETSPTGAIATILQFRRGETVTAAQLRQEVADRGVEAAPKEIYNAIEYMA